MNGRLCVFSKKQRKRNGTARVDGDLVEFSGMHRRFEKGIVHVHVGKQDINKIGSS